MGYSSILLGYSSILMGYSFILLGYSIINYPIYPLLGYHDYGTWGENWAPRSQKWPLCIPHFQTLPYSKNSNHQKDGFNLSQIICLNLFWDDFICLSFLGGYFTDPIIILYPKRRQVLWQLLWGKRNFTCGFGGTLAWKCSSSHEWIYFSIVFPGYPQLRVLNPMFTAIFSPLDCPSMVEPY